MLKLSEPAPTIDSREVAQMVGKRHADLLRDIGTYVSYMSDTNQRNFASVDFFQDSAYIDGKGEQRRCYLVTKKGCELIAHKLTGKKGVLFTAAYINRFHELEEALRTPPPAQVMYYKGHPILPEEDFLRMIPLENQKKRWLYKRPYFRPGWDYNGAGWDIKAQLEQEYGRHYEGNTLMYLHRSGVQIALRLYEASPALRDEVMALMEPTKAPALNANPKQTYQLDMPYGEISLTAGNMALSIRI
ncbi:Rha family transcriptional regulator [Anaeromassilibacillus senegalensis]|uniref:Rha family transcriptional regulator n=1 Tax=Anaeromassilibacillus senegalensis TaxID=1673717 RepID=UPI00067FF8EA|nr:Rha family transcriptional regulator [Anaeromassilibacillus senegalensis]